MGARDIPVRRACANARSMRMRRTVTSLSNMAPRRRASVAKVLRDGVHAADRVTPRTGLAIHLDEHMVQQHIAAATASVLKQCLTSCRRYGCVELEEVAPGIERAPQVAHSMWFGRRVSSSWRRSNSSAPRHPEVFRRVFGVVAGETAE